MNNDQSVSPSAHGQSQFKPNTTVAAVIVHQDRYLFVEEVDNGVHVLNQPAGHLEANEHLVDAVKREVVEETGLTLTPDYISGVYYFYRPELNLYFLRFCFVFELPEALAAQPQDDEILATHWLTLAQLKASDLQLRSPMVLECVEDYIAGKKMPLSMLKSNL